MHSGVGTGGSIEFYRAFINFLEGFFYLAADGSFAGLELKPMEIGSLIGKN